MPVNMNTADRIIRALIAVVIGFLYFTDRISGTLGIALLVLAVVFLISSFFARCPGYSLLGISTHKAGSTPSA